MFKKSLIAASVLAASVAMADASVPAAHNGFYTGVFAGYGTVGYVNANGTNIVDKNHGIDGGFNAGYMFNDTFGAEAGFIQYSKVSTNDLNGASITQNYNMYVAGVAKYDFTNDFDVYAKLGLADVHSKFPAGIQDSDGHAIQAGGVSRFTAFAGAGVGYLVMPNVRVSLEADLTPKTGVVAGMYSLNAGVSYLF